MTGRTTAQRRRARPATEAEFTGQVAELAALYGWTRYHTWLSIHSKAGFPDEVLVRGPRLIFAELKSDAGKVKPAQQDWLTALRQVPGVEVYLWRPADFDEINRVLGPERVDAAQGVGVVDLGFDEER